ncbi:large subunit ribosomal protein L2 [Mycoplasmoides fastidiosum]|uniref:Large ribosomal subunit protein uL2 n=1 Tax=Mycoplasmoides fastidiosum TaxID=92758 RepID=A0ABU0LY48_9BACT|nr:50S ribosomal protein L2 [Mycoplasmoides fastidiosum]MDQ0513631.1 large subunit ribosomal protein L2 [Mycoplasmoides fastidiosum]UUD37949.1 50S ribosomal protein L2 [Mycoplasmoides fastidiosum]
MAIKHVKPRSSGRRNIRLIDYKRSLSATQPEKSLTKTLKKTGGRNNLGKITTRHRGGGHKRKYRMIDFHYDKPNIEATVKTIEYDPNRTAFISLVAYKDGTKRYVLNSDGLKVGDKIVSGYENIDIKPGNCLPLGQIPEGTFIHSIELAPRKGAQLVRSAGSQAQVLGRDETEKYVVVKLPSNEMRKFLLDCRAVIGRVSNSDHNLVNLGKAGASRRLGIRPTVRGSAMNPNDHVHGGGEGRSPVGRKQPRTPWGKPHMGVRTRNKKKPSNSLIVKSRHMKSKRK